MDEIGAPPTAPSTTVTASKEEMGGNKEKIEVGAVELSKREKLDGKKAFKKWTRDSDNGRLRGELVMGLFDDASYRDKPHLYWDPAERNTADEERVLGSMGITRDNQHEYDIDVGTLLQGMALRKGLAEAAAAGDAGGAGDDHEDGDVEGVSATAATAATAGAAGDSRGAAAAHAAQQVVVDRSVDRSVNRSVDSDGLLSALGDADDLSVDSKMEASVVEYDPQEGEREEEREGGRGGGRWCRRRRRR